jgi:hypothetical protein
LIVLFKIQITLFREGEQKELENETQKPKKLPQEQDLLKYTSVGVGYTKSQYQDKASRDIGEIPPARSPGTPSKWESGSPKGLPPIVNRAPPVEKIAIPDITKNVRALFEKGSFEDEHKPKKLLINIRDAPDGGVYENQPTMMEGVVRESDVTHDEEQVYLQAGHTKDVLEKYTRASSDEVPRQRAPIQLAEDDGVILESQPVMRTDVVRESDQADEEIVLERGKARSLRDRFTNYQEAPKERKVIKLYEDDQATPVIVENNPEPVREDIVRSKPEDDNVMIEVGRAKNLKGFFSEQRETQITRAPINVAEGQGIILENQPTRRDDVVRETDDCEDRQNTQIETGRAKNMKALWAQKQLEDSESSSKPKPAFKLDISGDGPVVLENQPVVRDDVVRGDPVEEVIPVERGRIRNMAGAFVNREEQPKAPREKIIIERHENEDYVIENEPEQLPGDVVRSSDPNVIQVEAGRTRSMTDYWKKAQEEEDAPRDHNGDIKPKWLLEIEAAKLQQMQQPEEEEEYQQYTDEDAEEHLSIIPQGKGQSLKQLWAQKMQEEEEKTKPLELVRFTPPRELTPPRTYQETQKSTTVFTFGQQAQDEAAAALQQHNGYSNGHSAAAPAGGEPVRSTAVVKLRTS